MALTLGAGTPPDMTITGFGPIVGPSIMGLEAGVIHATGSVTSDTGLQTSGSAGVAGTLEAGVIRLTGNAAPADATLEAGEVSFWFDKTDGAAKLMVKGKTADGTVKTGSLNVAT